MPWLLILAICSSTLAESMQEGEPLVIKLNYMATILMIMMPRKMQIVMIEVLCHYKWAGVVSLPAGGGSLSLAGAPRE